MPELLPLATYNLKVEPYTPTPAIDVTVPVTVRITLAAVDPEAVDEEGKPSTLRIIKRNPDFDDDEDDILGGDFNEDELDDESEEEPEPVQEKPAKKGKKGKKQVEEKPESEEEEEEEDEEEEFDDEFQEFVVLTLSPKVQFQQTLDLVIAPEEEVQFVLTGSYPIHLTGNYVKHPFDQPQYGDDDEDSECDSDCDSEEYDLTPDEDEVLENLEDASDIESRIEELVQQEEEQKTKNKNKKRKSQEQDETEKVEEAPKETKKAKKEEPKKDKKEKKVEFKKNLEEGPSKKAAKEEKPKTQALEGGIVVEDRVVGKGKTAKKGSKVGMRYIGKLKNGKVFDKNTSGKPFNFNLGRGEVIKGWDIGVSGMAVGGERRIVIPAPYAYGKQALPGLPANSELTFDVKLVSMK
ncbi:LANO_0B01640g1_1 [Lachancea nothofagi CBS 11611]|uniref:FK506-binding protein n=1 Tax=Lachancea nothofagi CBS 11611 TaxID=1266666 RepID=A0A1G4IVX5_9SACH|nr:LANO_0B01640g1_1 [Lachancea nothofagi CBS 11611]